MKRKSAKMGNPPVYVSDGVYDFLKFFVMIVAPSAASLYILAGKLFDMSDTVLYLIVAYLLGTAFLGGLLISFSKIKARSPWGKDGSMIVKEKNNGDMLYSLELDQSPEVLQEKEVVSFLVIKDDRNLNNAYNETN